MQKIFLLLLLIPHWVLAQNADEKIFSKQQVMDDAAQMLGIIENVHPHPYHEISKEDLQHLLNKLSGSLKENVNEREAWVFFSSLIAAYNEGHSSIGYPENYFKSIQENKVPLLPLIIREFNGKELVVRYDLSSDSSHLLKTGDGITKINGHPVEELMNTLMSLYGGLDEWRKLRVIGDFPTALIMINIMGPYHISYTSDGVEKQRTINPELRSAMMTKVAGIRKQNPTAPAPAAYSFSRLEDNVGYINFRSMRDLPAFEKFLDSVFTDIRNNNVNGLLIDLRQNGGGNSILGEKLIGYISNKPFRMGGGSKWKVSDEYKAFINEQAAVNPVYKSENFRSYLSRPTGEIISQDGGNTYSVKNKLRYDGKVCVLTGPNTFSSANMLANAIKDYQLATIIGQPTGECANDYGELFWKKLPNTGLTFYTCSKQFVRANGDANDPNPVLPDFEARQQPKSLKDDVLEFARQWVKWK